jgi:hypothetical protein
MLAGGLATRGQEIERINQSNKKVEVLPMHSK